MHETVIENGVSNIRLVPAFFSPSDSTSSMVEHDGAVAD